MPQYQVKAGDTLSKIAQQYGYGGDYMSLAKANNIANPNVIQAGSTLNIPDRSAPGAAPASAPAPVQQQPQVQSGGGVPPVDMSKYAGWNDQAAIQADWNNNWQSKGGGATPGANVSSFLSNQVQTPDLSGQWTKGLESIGATFNPQVEAANAEAAAVQSKLTARTEALNVALGKINDNPYYSEATRVGRAAKLKEAYNNDVGLLNSQLGLAQNKVTNTQNLAEKAKADLQVKLNIDTQMYNIKNQQYQQNLQVVNSMLSSGALNNASGADMAEIALKTGMSTGMVQSMIEQAKKSKEVKPTLQAVSDSTGQYIYSVSYDAQGNPVVSGKQKVGEATSTGTGTTNSTMDTQKLYDKYDVAIKSVLEQVDVMNQKGNTKKADRKLASYEVQAAIQQIATQLGIDQEQAAELLAKGMSGWGYSKWTG